MIILKILGIIILIYFTVVVFCYIIIQPLCILYGQIAPRIYWKVKRPVVCRQLRESGFSEEEIEQLAPKKYKIFINMESEDYDRILAQAEKRIDRETLKSIMANIRNKRNEATAEE